MRIAEGRNYRRQRGEKARQTAALVSMGISVKRLIVICRANGQWNVNARM
jgi:hypothetical protein